MVIGEKALTTVFLIVTFHSALLFGITSALTLKENKFDWKMFLKQIFYNPLIIAILSGVVFNLLSLPLPTIINDTLLLLGKPAISLALFVLGASLAFYHIHNELKFICYASLLKLVILPSLVYVTSAYIFEFDRLTITTLVLLSACPTGVNAYLKAMTPTCGRTRRCILSL